jgi:hypothetical protein
VIGSISLYNQKHKIPYHILPIYQWMNLIHDWKSVGSVKCCDENKKIFNLYTYHWYFIFILIFIFIYTFYDGIYSKYTEFYANIFDLKDEN